MKASWRVTLRLAWYLWSAARCPTPAIALWREQLIAGFDRLAGRLASADQDDDVLARCTADEFVLHLTINLAEAHLIDDVVSPAAACPSPRPRSGRRGLQLDAREALRGPRPPHCSSTPRSTASRTPSAGTPRCVTGTCCSEEESVSSALGGRWTRTTFASLTPKLPGPLRPPCATHGHRSDCGFGSATVT
jgi:hypothetical protein